MASQITFANNGVAVKPYAPVQLGGGRNAAGDLIIRWTPRARIGSSGIGTPVIPLTDPAIYSVRIYTDSTYTDWETRTAVGAATLTYTAAEQTTFFGSPQSTIYVGVTQADLYGPAGYEARGAI